MDCLFCKISKGEITCVKIFEDENVLAFLDIGPVNKGHTLVVPKKHYESFLDADDETLCRLVVSAKKIAEAVVKGTKADGFNLIVNNKKAAGQLVDHVHFHIIPRFRDDGYKHWPQGKYSEGEDKEIVEKIKKFL